MGNKHTWETAAVESTVSNLSVTEEFLLGVPFGGGDAHRNEAIASGSSADAIFLEASIRKRDFLFFIYSIHIF